MCEIALMLIEFFIFQWQNFNFFMRGQKYSKKMTKMYILVELFGTFTHSSATECILTLKRSGIYNYMYIWVVAITMGLFVLLQWKHFQLLFQQAKAVLMTPSCII